MTTFYCLRFETLPTCRARYPQEQGGPVIPPDTGFPFRRLLRLAGLRWRYSNPPRSLHGSLYSLVPIHRKCLLLARLNWLAASFVSAIQPRHGPHTMHSFQQLFYRCLRILCRDTCLFSRYHANDIVIMSQHFLISPKWLRKEGTASRYVN
jgi:hypothetical protein